MPSESSFGGAVSVSDYNALKEREEKLVEAGRHVSSTRDTPCTCGSDPWSASCDYCDPLMKLDTLLAQYPEKT